MIRGVGIHTGSVSRVRLHRAEGPIRFRRGRSEIAADVDRVVATDHCTVLGDGGERVALVEHLLAALHVAGFWRDVVIEVSAEELPILDGSAGPWLEALAEFGGPPAAPEPLRPLRGLTVEAGGGTVRLEPGGPRLCARIAYPHPAIGEQSWCGTPERWADTLPARTFGFMKEHESLLKRGFATAATLENAIVFDDDGPVGPLRFDDEPVRHKALDALGDLFLVTAPLHASIVVDRGSHSLHIAFVRTLRRHLQRERGET